MKRIIWVLLALGVGSLPAWAALGESVSSVNADVQAFGGQHVMVAKAGYNLHQITTRDGSGLNEFVSPAGTVFGVSWKGHSLPDFGQMLGPHLTDLQTGVRTHVIPRRGVTVQNGDFVLISIGHGRYSQIRAYIPSLIPANLTPEVVQ